MFAIIENGGKQYKVSKGSTLNIEYTKGNVGDALSVGNVLLLKSDKNFEIGKPNIETVCVNANIVFQGRHKKIKIIKFRRRKHSLTSKGHRQFYTKIIITSIERKN
jgi:large subunit ribosomal protein L21